MKWYSYAAFALLFLAILIFVNLRAKRERRQRMKRKIREQWGSFSKREYAEGEYARISYFSDYMDVNPQLFRTLTDICPVYPQDETSQDETQQDETQQDETLQDETPQDETTPQAESLVDDITWNDLNMDELFQMLNVTDSSAGEETLYFLLRHPMQTREAFDRRNQVIGELSRDRDRALALKEIFYELGRTKSISFCEFITRLEDLKEKRSFRSYICLGLILAAAASLLISPGVGIILVIAAIFFNVFMYYSLKGEVESWFINFCYISRLIRESKKLPKTWKTAAAAETQRQGSGADETLAQDAAQRSGAHGTLDDIWREIAQLCEELRPLAKGDRFFEKNSMGDSLSSMILDYVMMITHLDLISFQRMAQRAIASKDKILKLFYLVGYVESCLAVVSAREALTVWCVPTLEKPETEVRSGGSAEDGGARPEQSGKVIRDGGARPEQNFLRIRDISHPLLKDPVRNSIETGKCVLLTGSNASGKSTFLKAVAVNAILAQTVCTVSASSYQGMFYHVYTSMALRDDICGGESYFIVEIKSLKRILDHIRDGEHVLCFVDEVLRGTNTVERIAASKEILKNIAATDACCFAATHDLELTRLLEGRFVNYHFRERIEEENVVFDYRLREGSAVTRNAIRLLKAMNYPETVIENAEKSAEDFLKKGQWT